MLKGNSWWVAKDDTVCVGGRNVADLGAPWLCTVPSSSLSLHLSGLWKVKGWPKEHGDADVTSHRLLDPSGNCSTFISPPPQPGFREEPPRFLLPAWKLTSWTVAAILASSTFITLPAWAPSLREDGTRITETPLCS